MDKHVSGWGRGDAWKTLTILEEAGLSEDLPSAGSLGPLCEISTPFPLRKGGQPLAHSHSGSACGSPAASWWACLGLTMSSLHASVPRLQSLSLSLRKCPSVSERQALLSLVFILVASTFSLLPCDFPHVALPSPPLPCWGTIREG